jgi:hypothetical protein
MTTAITASRRVSAGENPPSAKKGNANICSASPATASNRANLCSGDASAFRKLAIHINTYIDRIQRAKIEMYLLYKYSKSRQETERIARRYVRHLGISV